MRVRLLRGVGPSEEGVVKAEGAAARGRLSREVVPAKRDTMKVRLLGEVVPSKYGDTTRATSYFKLYGKNGKKRFVNKTWRMRLMVCELSV